MRNALLCIYLAPIVAYVVIRPFVFGLSVRHRMARVDRLIRTGRPREALRVLDRLDVESAAYRRKHPHWA